MKRFFLLFIILKTLNLSAQTIRPVVYPKNGDSLKLVITESMHNYDQAQKNSKVFALVMSHMGAISHEANTVAAKQVLGHSYKRIIILGNSHRGSFPEIKIDDHDYWDSPCGKVATDKSFADSLIASSELFKYDSSPHDPDHTIESVIPYLQTALKGEFKIVPILFGNSYYIGKDINDNYKEVAKLLMNYMNKDDLLVITSDMTHFYTDKQKQLYVDSIQIDLIKNIDIKGLEKFEHQLAIQDDANKKIMNCSIDGIKTMLEMYNAKSCSNIEQLSYDTFYHESRDRYISYGAWVIYDN